MHLLHYCATSNYFKAPTKKIYLFGPLRSLVPDASAICIGGEKIPSILRNASFRKFKFIQNISLSIFDDFQVHKIDVNWTNLN
jgi:hypothetical protein